MERTVRLLFTTLLILGLERGSAQIDTTLEKKIDAAIREQIGEKLSRGPVEFNLSLRYGFSGGARLEGIAPTLIRAELYDGSTYTVQEAEEDRQVNRIGIGFTVRPKYVPLYFETAVDYEWMHRENMPTNTEETRENWDFYYKDDNGLKYWMWFNYNYVVISETVALPLFGVDFAATDGRQVLWPGVALSERKWPGTAEKKRERESSGSGRSGGGRSSKTKLDYGHFARGFSVRALCGMSVAFNASPRDIYYRSNKPELGPDLQIQENLRNTLTGRTNIAFVYGGEITWRWLGISYTWRDGMSDVIRTEANPYYMQEVENRRNVYKQWAVKLILPLVPIKQPLYDGKDK